MSDVRAELKKIMREATAAAASATNDADRDRAGARYRNAWNAYQAECAGDAEPYPHFDKAGDDE